MLEGSPSAALASGKHAALLAKAKRKRPHYRRELTTVDRRSRVFRRITELQALFLSALESAGVELSPLRRMKIEEAAQLKALAEKTRGDYLRDGVGTLDDIVRIERKAELAVKGLGIVEGKAAQRPRRLADVLRGAG